MLEYISHMVEPGRYYDEEVIILNIVINMYVLFIHWNNLHQMNGHMTGLRKQLIRSFLVVICVRFHCPRFRIDSENKTK
jgi:Sec-independent protein secretion pathway component TatC